MTISAYTCAGMGKLQNEDTVIIGGIIHKSGELRMTFPSGIVAVADGVGGNNGGQFASEFVAKKLCTCVPTDITKALLVDINNELISLSESNDELYKMATTLSGIAISDGKILLFHVGNTRIYSFTHGYLKQLSHDDTLVNMLVKTGVITPEQSLTHSRRNEITACFGGGDSLLLDIKLDEICVEDISTLVMTSDGVHEFIPVDALEEMLSSGKSLGEICEVARNNGSQDDCSIVVLRTD